MLKIDYESRVCWVCDSYNYCAEYGKRRDCEEFRKEALKNLEKEKASPARLA